MGSADPAGVMGVVVPIPLDEERSVEARMYRLIRERIAEMQAQGIIPPPDRQPRPPLPFPSGPRQLRLPFHQD